MPKGSQFGSDASKLIAERLWDILLSDHHGPDQSVLANGLCMTYRIRYDSALSDRVCRAAISWLVTEQKKPICSFPSGGFFVATTTDELEAARLHLRSRAMSCLLRAQALRRTQPIPPQHPHFQQQGLL